MISVPAFLILFCFHISPSESRNAAASAPPRFISLRPFVAHLPSSSSKRVSSNLDVPGSTTLSGYFLSQNSASFSTALEDCTTVFGETASLLVLETQEEHANVSALFMSSDTSGSSYWIGGKYNLDKQRFAWINSASFGSWAPWSQGHPKQLTRATRVFASYRPGQPIQFRTAFQTSLKRYICEVPSVAPAEEPLPCYENNDLVIVVDSSGSISPDQYKIALEFTARLASAWADNPGNRLSIIVYSTQATPIFNLSPVSNVAQLRDVIYKAPHFSQSTASHLALDQVLKQFSRNQRSVTKNLVFLTDGESDNRILTANAAGEVLRAGVRSFSVGIGSGVGTAELLTLAGGDRQRMFTVNNFNQLLALLRPVSRRVCN